jgi:hypothetical protein
MKGWRRWRWTAAVLLVLVLLVALPRRVPVGAAPAPSPFAAERPVPSPQASPAEPETLQVGTYITSLDSFDLRNSSFEAGFYLWTLWNGPEPDNPSDALELINDVYNGDVYEFEQLARRREGDLIWTLYSVHSRFVHRWRLHSYPFDRHVLRLRVGLRDPYRSNVRLEADTANSGASPDLYLYGWNLGDIGISRIPLSLLSDLGRPATAGEVPAEVPTITTSIELSRRARLHLLPDFLGYVLAVGLCVLALLIQRSRDDLILAAVVSAAGNYVFLAGILPVGAMSGFIGNLQLVILAGILYVVAADETLDHHLEKVAPRLASFLRSAVLPSYLLMTMLAIYLIIPTGVIEAP